MKYWLEVPFEEKDQAKAAGARWDPTARRWYSSAPPRGALERWFLPDLPPLLPGEDRGFGGGLFVDLVPRTCWFTNVRSCVSQQDWARIRRMMILRAGSRCEACGQPEDRSLKRWLEAHERWHYDETHMVQSLKRLILLCTDCHQATHYGFAQLKGLAGNARATLMRVNSWTPAQVEEHIAGAFAHWERRNQHDWHLDLSILTTTGIDIASPPAAENRWSVGQAKLAEVRLKPRSVQIEESPEELPNARGFWSRLFRRS